MSPQNFGRMGRGLKPGFQESGPSISHSKVQRRVLPQLGAMAENHFQWLQSTRGRNHPDATDDQQHPTSKHHKVSKNKQQASRSLQASTHKPLQSNSNRPKSLQGAACSGVPKSEYFPTVGTNNPRGARAVPVLPQRLFCARRLSGGETERTPAPLCGICVEYVAWAHLPHPPLPALSPPKPLQCSAVNAFLDCPFPSSDSPFMTAPRDTDMTVHTGLDHWTPASSLNRPLPFR